MLKELLKPAHCALGSGRWAGLALATGLAMGGAAAPAYADNAKVEDMSFSIAPTNSVAIDVYSSNGSKWDTIKGKQIPLWADIEVDTKWPGYVQEAAIFLGACSSADCPSFPKMMDLRVGARDLNHEGQVNLDTAAIPLSGAGIAPLPYGDKILSLCNAELQANGATQGHSFPVKWTATLAINTDKARYRRDMNGGNVFTGFAGGGDHRERADFGLKVKCHPYKPVQDPQVGFDHGDMKVRSVKLFLTTYQGVDHMPGPGLSCPVLDLKARFEASQVGLVRGVLRQQIAGGSLSSIPITVEAKQQANGKIIAEYRKQLKFNQTTYAQFQVEERENPIELSTPWKDITLHCTGGGGSGLNSDAGPQDNLPSPAHYDGKLTLLDSARPGNNRCPRGGKLEFEITSNKKGTVPYRIDCTNGQSWQGFLGTSSNGSGKYRGFARQSFNVSKSEKVVCALKRVADGNARVLALRGRQYACSDSISGGASTGSKPPSGNPVAQPTSSDKPTWIPDPAVVSCRGGRIAQGKCKCRRGKRAVRVGSRHYRCVGRPSSASVPLKPRPDPTAGSDSKADTRISCAGGIVRKGRCHCPRTHKPVKAGKNAYRCVKSAANPARTNKAGRVKDPAKRRPGARSRRDAATGALRKRRANTKRRSSVR